MDVDDVASRAVAAEIDAAGADAAGPEVDSRAEEAVSPAVGIDMDEALADLTARLTAGERIRERPSPARSTALSGRIRSAARRGWLFSSAMGWVPACR